MLVDWNSSASWLTMLTSGPGVQRDDVEAASSADATMTNLSVVPSVFSGTGMVSAVQSWANGAPNRGWLLWQNSSNSWTVNTNVDYSRPVLKITYKPRVSSTAAMSSAISRFRLARGTP